MGTRACFWLGKPEDEGAKWLGCVAFDGYEWAEEWKRHKKLDRAGFEKLVRRIKKTRQDFDFADPRDGGFPFPWVDDVYLTDYTYAFFDGRPHYCRFHGPWEFELNGEPHGDDEYRDMPEKANVPMPEEYRYWDRGQPDSIIVMTGK